VAAFYAPVVAAEPKPLDAPTDGDGEDESKSEPGRRRRRRRGRRSRSDRPDDAQGSDESDEASQTGGAQTGEAQTGEARPTQPDGSDERTGSGSSRRRRRGRGSRGDSGETRGDEVTALRGSTRLEAKRQRRRDGRESGRRRQIITEAEFLTRRESVERQMVVRERDGRTQIAVLEDGVLVEHYVSDQAQSSMVGSVYLGRVQNVLPSMEAAFVDVGKGRNAVLYAGEVNWDAAGLDGGQPRRIEQALKSGDTVLVQVTKDPIGHKGARLTSQVTLAGRYLVLVPRGGMTGISHKLPDAERHRLKKVLRTIVPDAAGVIVRTAAEGATEAELAADIARLQAQWDAIEAKSRTAAAPALLQGEPDLAIRVVRDVFNDDFAGLVVSGDQAWTTISDYVRELAPDLSEKVAKWTGPGDVFAKYRIDEQLAKGMDRKVWLPSGGSLVIDRTEAMTVIDVNTGKFTGSGGTLEETVTRNNLEAAEEIVRQLRLRDIGGMIVVDFIDMVLESNRDLVLRRLVEALGRDRTKHQVAEVTSLGLVQLTRKRVGQGLVEAFSETCEHCHGRGFIVHSEPVGASRSEPTPAEEPSTKRKHRRRSNADMSVPVLPEAREAVKAKLATIAAAAAQAHELPDGAVPDGAVPDGAVVDSAVVDGSDTPADGQAVEPGADQTESTQAVEAVAVEPVAEEPTAEQETAGQETAGQETAERETAERESAEQRAEGPDAQSGTAEAVGLTGGVAQP
jgi:ribonuclease E